MVLESLDAQGTACAAQWPCGYHGGITITHPLHYLTYHKCHPTANPISELQSFLQIEDASTIQEGQASLKEDFGKSAAEGHRLVFYYRGILPACMRPPKSPCYRKSHVFERSD